MRCIDLDCLVEHSTGKVFTVVGFEDRTSVTLPYRKEHINLLNLDIINPAQFTGGPTAAVQEYCPYCNGVLHTTLRGHFCYNVHCAATRIVFIQQQLGVFGIHLPQSLLMPVFKRLYADPVYDIVSFFNDGELCQERLAAQLADSFRRMTIRQYLYLIRIPKDYYEEEITDLSDYFNNDLTEFHSKASGNMTLDEWSDIGVDRDLFSAIQFSFKFVNPKFATELFLQSNRILKAT